MSQFPLVSRRQTLLYGALLAGAPFMAFGQTPKSGGTLTFVFNEESTTLVAVNNTSGTAWTLGPKIFDALLSYDAELTPQPQLATDWTISPDGLTYAFKLRAGVKWHDGTPFTSTDVAFTIQHLKVAHPRGRGDRLRVRMQPASCSCPRRRRTKAGRRLVRQDRGRAARMTNSTSLNSKRGSAGGCH